MCLLLGLPSAEQSCRCDNQHGPALVIRRFGHPGLQPNEKGQGLEGLAQPLIISVQKTGMTGTPPLNLPCQRLALVIEQRRADCIRHLGPGRLTRCALRRPILLHEVLVNDDHVAVRTILVVTIARIGCLIRLEAARGLRLRQRSRASPGLRVSPGSGPPGTRRGTRPRQSRHRPHHATPRPSPA